MIQISKAKNKKYPGVSWKMYLQWLAYTAYTVILLSCSAVFPTCLFLLSPHKVNIWLVIVHTFQCHLYDFLFPVALAHSSYTYPWVVSRLLFQSLIWTISGLQSKVRIARSPRWLANICVNQNTWRGETLLDCVFEPKLWFYLQEKKSPYVIPCLAPTTCSVVS